MNASEIKVGSMVKADGREYTVIKVEEPGENTKKAMPTLVAHILIAGKRKALKIANLYNTGYVRIWADGRGMG